MFLIPDTTLLSVLTLAPTAMHCRPKAETITAYQQELAILFLGGGDLGICLL